MKTAARLLLFFFISVAALVLNEGPVHAGTVLKRDSLSAQTHKNPSDHNPNLLIEEVDVAPSGPNPGGNSVTQSISQGLNLQFQKCPFDTNNQRDSISAQSHKNPSDHPNLLIDEVDVAPSGPNPGGNSVTQSISQGFNYVHKNPSDHPNLLIEEVDVAPSGPNPDGNSVTQSISQGLNLQFQKGPFDTNNQRLSRVVDGDDENGDICVQSISETLKINKLPCGSSGGVGTCTTFN